MANEDFRELSLDDLEGVAGGFEFYSNSVTNNWMDGYEVRCPHCGNSEKDLIHQGATLHRNTTYFICNKCGKQFKCRVVKKDYDARNSQWKYDITTEP